jgi:hypothetical protein
MSMKKPLQSMNRRQLNFFHPRPSCPEWLNFPPEVRQEVKHLLVRLFHQHLSAAASLAKREVRDER